MLRGIKIEEEVKNIRENEKNKNGRE